MFVMVSWDAVQRYAATRYFNRSTGIVSSGQGMTGDESLATVFLLVLMGAFVGVLFGLLASNLLRFLSMCSGRSIGSVGWTIAGGAVLGAAISALLVFSNRD
jgi:hypothetical protein